jgi:hypothetical protein
MGADVKSLTINGVTYVPKGEEQGKVTEDIFLVRSYGAGVYYGEIKKKEQTISGLVVTMTNARRVWCWWGAATLSQLSVDGTSQPDKCQFPCKVSEVELQNVVEILPLTEKALKSLEAVKIWIN